MSHLTLHPVLPFDFDQSLAFIHGFAPTEGDQAAARGQLITGGYAAERPFIARVQADEGGETLHVEIEWLEAPDDPQAVGQWLRRFLSLEDDLEPLYRAAEGDPAFQPVVQALYGYHQVRFPTAFEAACWAALSQRTPWKAARRQKQALAEIAGQVVKQAGDRIVIFPTPGRLLAHRQEVEMAVRPARKSRTLLAAAHAFLQQDLHALEDEPLEAALRDIWGFGDWSSEFVLLRGFGRLSRVPAGERRLREAVAELYRLGKEQASESDLARLSARYGEWAGNWAHYIRVWVDRNR